MNRQDFENSNFITHNSYTNNNTLLCHNCPAKNDELYDIDCETLINEHLDKIEVQSHSYLIHKENNRIYCKICEKYDKDLYSPCKPQNQLESSSHEIEVVDDCIYCTRCGNSGSDLNLPCENYSENLNPSSINTCENHIWLPNKNTIQCKLCNCYYTNY